jgi:hypothetical protein
MLVSGAKATSSPTERTARKGGKNLLWRPRAIARLCSRGYVRVIVTTNFCRLVKRALELEGIAPVVIDTPDAAEGTPLLPHSGCTVVKVNGDYLDTRIKNTPVEFGEYDDRINALLARIFKVEMSVFISATDCRLDLCSRGPRHAPQVELLLIETLQLRLERFRN